MKLNTGNRVIISVDEASQQYNLSISYLSLLARQQKIEAFKMGQSWVLYEDSLAAFLSQPRKPGPKPKSSSSASKDTMAQKSGDDQR